MSGFNFPNESTKVAGVNRKFDLNVPGERQLYFKMKAEKEIEKIKIYLENNTFIAMMIGKKNSGKGTRVNMLKEIFGEDKITLLSVGDLTRQVFDELQTPEGM